MSQRLALDVIVYDKIKDIENSWLGLQAEFPNVTDMLLSIDEIYKYNGQVRNANSAQASLYDCDQVQLKVAGEYRLASNFLLWRDFTH